MGIKLNLGTKEIIQNLKSLSNPNNVEEMARFGIGGKNVLGISIASLRKIAKEIGKNHNLAQELWKTEIHEARILASIIDDPKEVTEEQMESWVIDFDSWDLCDQVCMGLFRKTSLAWKKAFEWAEKEEEFVKRAGFVLIATLSVHEKKVDDKEFLKFFPMIKEKSIDKRNFVKKAVNWALRQIGKRSEFLRIEALKLCEEISKIDSKSARWITNDARRELEKGLSKYSKKL